MLADQIVAALRANARECIAACLAGAGILGGVILLPNSHETSHAAEVVQVCVNVLMPLGIVTILCNALVDLVGGEGLSTLVIAGCRSLVLCAIVRTLLGIDESSYRQAHDYLRLHPDLLVAAAIGMALVFVVNGIGRSSGRLISPPLLGSCPARSLVGLKSDVSEVRNHHPAAT